MNKFFTLILLIIFTSSGYAQISNKSLALDDGFVEVEEVISKISADSLKILIDKGEKGDTSVQAFLTVLYYNGERIEEDLEKSFYWCEKAAKLGNIKAMFHLGIFYEYGNGIKQDYLKAKYWYENASKLNNIDAMFALGQLYELHSGEIYANFKGDVAVDYTIAKYWYEKAANLGQSDAMFNLGSMYDDGRGIAKDYTKAKNWYEKAANLGNNDAMNNLGLLYQNGQGVAKNCIKAKYWFEKSAELKNKYAFYNLAELYNMNISQGEYLVIQDNCDEIKDNKLAIEWHERSVQSGNINSLFKLGEINEAIGKYDEAKDWYDKAIENNNTSAMVSLGRMYRFGNGVEQSYENAKELFAKAYKLGDKTAYSQIQFIEEINPDKINGISLVKRKSISKENSFIDFSNGWIYLTETKNDIKLFKEVAKDGYSNIKVWVKSIPKSNQLAGYRNENSSLFKSATIKQKISTQLSSYKSLYVLNCKENKIGEKSSVYYTKDGAVIYTDNNELFNEYDMSEVIPETIGEDILKTICEYYEKYGK